MGIDKAQLAREAERQGFPSPAMVDGKPVYQVAQVAEWRRRNIRPRGHRLSRTDQAESAEAGAGRGDGETIGFVPWITQRLGLPGVGPEVTLASIANGEGSDWWRALGSHLCFALYATMSKHCGGGDMPETATPNYYEAVLDQVNEEAVAAELLLAVAQWLNGY